MSLSFRPKGAGNRSAALFLLPLAGVVAGVGATLLAMRLFSAPVPPVAPAATLPPAAPTAPTAPAAPAAATAPAAPVRPVASKPKPASGLPQVVGTVPIPARFQGQIFSGKLLSRQDKVVALTFDDGPWEPTTPQVLEILKKNDIKATFFVIGKFVETFPGMLQDVVSDGHVIASHSWSHPYKVNGQAQILKEIDGTANIVKQVSGFEVNLFRPPGGKLKTGLADYAMKRGYALIRWTVVSGDDVRGTTPDKMIKNVLSQVKPGAVVLLHDGGGKRPTVEALPKIIEGLRKMGYRFVTVPELLEMQKT
jgi:chitin deacetylase